ncbi:hypothetical protein [Salegentibacter sp.]|uniref:hypothetical protein n=1 Tax=Salegentibacter sp. TaxID=1903072 RepID=UPI0035657AFE
MKKYLWFALSFFVFCNYTLKAQEEFKSGYLVDLESDTLRGFIKEDTDARLAKSLTFKTSLQDSGSKEYTPKELKAFGFDYGRNFKRQRSNLKDSPGFVFTKRLLKGKTDLYVWRKKGQSKPDMFITNNEIDKTVHLVNPSKRKLTAEDGKKFSGKDRKYLGLLNSIKTEQQVQDRKDIRFSEKRIYEDLLDYNRQFSENHPVSEYEEKQVNRYEILVGMPLENAAGATQFRVSILRDKQRIERSRNWSYLRGISYRHWGNEDRELPDFKNGTANYRWQTLSLIPIGVKYQSAKGVIRPYAYAGLGAGLLLMTDYVIENYENTGNDKVFGFGPTANIGAGLKIKLGDGYLLTEITPTIDGVFFNGVTPPMEAFFFNLGYSF